MTDAGKAVHREFALRGFSRGLALAAALLGGTAAYAQQHELGVRYWLSTGETTWNHTAGSPVLGDPTSVLT